MPLGEEIGVISEELLQRVVAEQAPQAIKAYGKDSGASDAAVVALRLDFQSLRGLRHCSPWHSCLVDILRINNLWSFANLKKLQLDNNIIEKIENLEMLVHLEWLGSSHSTGTAHPHRIQTYLSTTLSALRALRPL
jgi:hypothetical protein